MSRVSKIASAALLALFAATSVQASSLDALIQQLSKPSKIQPVYPKGAKSKKDVKPVLPVKPAKTVHALEPAKVAPKDEVLVKGISKLYKKYNPRLKAEVATSMAQSTVHHCRARGVDPALLAGIIIVESRANPQARNRSMLGLCQVHWGVHAKTVLKKFPQIKSKKDMFLADNNIAVGAWIFSGYLQACRGDETKALYRYLGRHNTKYVKRVKGYRREVLTQ